MRARLVSTRRALIGRLPPRLRRRLDRLAPLLVPEARALTRGRREVARRHLAGQGLEIGALHHPLPAPRGTRVRYVDRMPVAELRVVYPELDGLPLVSPDVVDDGERLGRLPDASVDFIIANHFIEHCQDPIGTLANQLRVLRPGGVLYLAVPDRRRTFDCHRGVTPLEHLVRDHADGPEWSREAHYLEWARVVLVPSGDIAPEDADRRARELEAQDYSIHFHTFEPLGFLELLAHCRREGLDLEIAELRSNGIEFIVIVRRSMPG